MHQSAKNYICLIKVPLTPPHFALVYSVVGCLALMGATTRKTFVGVNNINTRNGHPALIWPFLVRTLLTASSIDEMRPILISASLTSGHNYLIADPNMGEHWEIGPYFKEKIATTQEGAAFHTNHV